ncbi:putative Imidazoleglycerol phosphate synthase [Naematelia encephala]|uniref:Putative Imidazoleglycerol phosphate synthase n=1 Tax=Naematelia encephala TaxID=71784 RepID=A0A1Y2BMF6_9TREE|nr:putative Imidazoleglycerol phosphate synthase [Naematelia encephala]
MADHSLPIPPISQPEGHASSSRPKLYILDYGAGNVRSLANSIKKLGYEFEWIKDVSDFDKAEKLIFPGVGAFGQATASLRSSGLIHPLLDYIRSGRPYFGICIGMQMLFTTSTESPGAQGTGLIDYPISKFRAEGKTVPHMGWNNAWTAWSDQKGSETQEPDRGFSKDSDDYYFVHSYAAIIPPTANGADSSIAPFIHTLSRYGDETFVSSVRWKNVFGTQFHPEKSGKAGLEVLRKWLQAPIEAVSDAPSISTRQWRAENPNMTRREGKGPTNRIVACLDVRSNDAGDLVVTKGDQYDVREKDDTRGVRNLGKPVDLARRYYTEGADEICFLNITSFRSSALQDQPMLAVVRAAAETVFVPLTVGGGIKDTIDPDGTKHSALEVAGAYFRSGADKVSIGSEAVLAVEDMLARQQRGEPACTGQTGIETISEGYGSQAVVVSIDPKRVYYDTTRPNWIDEVPLAHRPCLIIGEKASTRTRDQELGKAWWYQCTISGGRAAKDIDVIQLAQGVEKLGAGELLLNSVDRDGSGLGFDLDLVRLVKQAVSIPVVASSGAGSVSDFEEVFRETGVEAALAAGIFHRSEVGIGEVKKGLEVKGMPIRREGM